MIRREFLSSSIHTDLLPCHARTTIWEIHLMGIIIMLVIQQIVLHPDTKALRFVLGCRITTL